MLNSIFRKEEEILNSLLNKELKIKRRGPDSFYDKGSTILFNEDGILYASETTERLEQDLNNLSLKLQNFQRLIVEFIPKIETVKS